MAVLTAPDSCAHSRHAYVQTHTQYSTIHNKVHTNTRKDCHNNNNILLTPLTQTYTRVVTFRCRASDPDEVYRVHEMKGQREQLEEEESRLDHLIQMCKHELSLLTENQENWQYPIYQFDCD